MMRYAISLAVAVLLIAAGAGYVRYVEQSFEQQARQRLREAKAAGKLPPEIDPEAPELPAMGFPLTAPEMRRIQIAQLLVAWRLVLILTVLLASLAIARIIRRRRP